EVASDFAAFVAQTIGSQQQARRFNGAAGQHEIGARDALDAAVGASDQDGDDVVAGSFDANDRAVRPERAAAGRERSLDEGDVGASLVGARAAVVAGAAVIAGGTAV